MHFNELRTSILLTEIIWISAENRTCHGWSECNGLCPAFVWIVVWPSNH